MSQDCRLCRRLDQRRFVIHGDVRRGRSSLWIVERHVRRGQLMAPLLPSAYNNNCVSALMLLAAMQVQHASRLRAPRPSRHPRRDWRNRRRRPAHIHAPAVACVTNVDCAAIRLNGATSADVCVRAGGENVDLSTRSGCGCVEQRQQLAGVGDVNRYRAWVRTGGRGSVARDADVAALRAAADVRTAWASVNGVFDDTSIREVTVTASVVGGQIHRSAVAARRAVADVPGTRLDRIYSRSSGPAVFDRQGSAVGKSSAGRRLK